MSYLHLLLGLLGFCCICCLYPAAAGGAGSTRSSAFVALDKHRRRTGTSCVSCRRSIQQQSETCLSWNILDTTKTENEVQRRRDFLFSSLMTATTTTTSALLLSLLPPSPANADTGAEVRGTKLNAFNGLIFQYRGSAFNGLRAEDINEPSISYAEFVSRLKAGEVSFVEFLAPDGDAAYVTFKNNDDSTNNKPPIRIGEGYPIEQHDGYSSSSFAIRTVKNAGVPYKFTVPGLSQYSSARTNIQKPQLVGNNY